MINNAAVEIKKNSKRVIFNGLKKNKGMGYAEDDLTLHFKTGKDAKQFQTDLNGGPGNFRGKFGRLDIVEEAELDEVRISDYVVDTLRNIKRSKSSRNLKLKGGDIKIDTETANKMLDFLDNMTSPMGKRKIIDILDKGTKKDFMKVNQAVMKAVK